VAAGLLAAAAPSPAEAARRPCGPKKGVRTVAVDGASRVYRQVKRVRRAGRVRRYFGCRRGSRTMLLGDSGPIGSGFRASFELIRLRGRYVAWVGGQQAPEDLEGEEDVWLVDLRRGRTRQVGVEGECTGTCVTDLELTRRGWIAWIDQGIVRKLDGRGEGELDTALGVEPTSLTVAGSRVSWVRDGQRLTAELGP
jgi:hypothetical protein